MHRHTREVSILLLVAAHKMMSARTQIIYHDLHGFEVSILFDEIVMSQISLWQRLPLASDADPSVQR